MSKQVISTELAVSELKKFLKTHLLKEDRRGKLTDEFIEEEYADVLFAIEEGNLVFVDNKPVFTLFEPLLNDEGQPSVTEISFRARIKGADKVMLMNGIDPKKQLGDYMIKIISFITQQPQPLVKRFGQQDFDVLNQICSVF